MQVSLYTHIISRALFKLKSFLITKVKLKCKISDNFDITIKDEKGCIIPDSITFAYFMVNTYNQSSFFEITINERKSVEESPVATPVQATYPQIQFQPIYENPDRFFIHFLSKVKSIVGS